MLGQTGSRLRLTAEDRCPQISGVVRVRDTPGGTSPALSCPMCPSVLAYHRRDNVPGQIRAQIGPLRAVDISQAAQQVAPKSGSAFIQATAQEGRGWARIGAGQETRAALGRVEALVSPLPVPERPEHHYRYDPAKSEAYLATTLAWIGDPAAERYARHVLARIESTIDGPPRPRRAASARLDLSLALIAAGRHDEAAGTTLEAISSGRLVPSNYWRAREVIQAVAERGVPEAAELVEAYREACGDGDRPALP